MSAELLRKAADLIEQRAADLATYVDRIRNDDQFDAPLLVDDDPPEVWAWSQTFRPQVAAPLVAWLRAEADGLDDVDAQFGPDAFEPDTLQHRGPAGDLARVILGEATP